MRQLLTTKTTVLEQKFKTINESEFTQLQAALLKKGELDIAISGTSMLPLVNNSDFIKVIPLISLNSLKRFDIIVYWNGEKLICHYFWHKNLFFKKEEKNIIIQTRPLNPIYGFDTPVEFNKTLGIVTNFKISTFQKFRIVFHYLISKYFF